MELNCNSDEQKVSKQEIFEEPKNNKIISTLFERFVDLRESRKSAYIKMCENKMRAHVYIDIDKWDDCLGEGMSYNGFTYEPKHRFYECKLIIVDGKLTFDNIKTNIPGSPEKHQEIINNYFDVTLKQENPDPNPVMDVYAH